MIAVGDKVTVLVNCGRVLHGVVSEVENWILGTQFIRVRRGKNISVRRAVIREGTDWMRGHHAGDSEEARAMLAARGLSW